jgi:hypothetical protein
LDHNAISDLSPLKGFPEFDFLTLDDNAIRDLSPLVAMRAFTAGDVIRLQRNAISCIAQRANIEALRQREIQIATDCP